MFCCHVFSSQVPLFLLWCHGNIISLVGLISQSIEVSSWFPHPSVCWLNPHSWYLWKPMFCCTSQLVSWCLLVKYYHIRHLKSWSRHNHHYVLSVTGIFFFKIKLSTSSPDFLTQKPYFPITVPFFAAFHRGPSGFHPGTREVQELLASKFSSSELPKRLQQAAKEVKQRIDEIFEAKVQRCDDVMVFGCFWCWFGGYQFMTIGGFFQWMI